MKDAFSDLKEACSEQQRKPASELIREGSTSWFAGRPTNAPRDTVALAQKGPFRVIIREEDVKSVEKHEDLYLVEVSADANILIGLEKVIKANLSGCGCHPKKQTPTEMHATVKDDTWINPDADLNVLVMGECYITVSCQSIAGHRVCFILEAGCGLN